MLRYYTLLMRLQRTAGMRLPQVPKGVGCVVLFCWFLYSLCHFTLQTFLADHPLKQRIIPLRTCLSLAHLPGRHEGAEDGLEQSVDANWWRWLERL